MACSVSDRTTWNYMLHSLDFSMLRFVLSRESIQKILCNSNPPRMPGNRMTLHVRLELLCSCQSCRISPHGLRLIIVFNMGLGSLFGRSHPISWREPMSSKRLQSVIWDVESHDRWTLQQIFATSSTPSVRQLLVRVYNLKTSLSSVGKCCNIQQDVDLSVAVLIGPGLSPRVPVALSASARTLLYPISLVFVWPQDVMSCVGAIQFEWANSRDIWPRRLSCNQLARVIKMRW